MTSTTIEIKVPTGMSDYVEPRDEKTELIRNALILYPYIKDLTISHGRAAEILGIRKNDLIDLYSELGIPYFNQDISDIEEELLAYESIA